MSGLNRKQNKKEEFVSVWDFETHTSYRIPARELAPGMVQVEMEGVDGVVWADASQLRQSEIKHPPFTEEVRVLIREIQQSVIEFYPLSLEEWEDGFRRDTNYEIEINIWLRLARTYKFLYHRREWSPTERKDIFRVLLACLNSPAEHVLKTCETEVLPPSEIRYIVRVYFQGPDYIASKGVGA